MYSALAELSVNLKLEFLLDVRKKCLEHNVNVAGKTNIFSFKIKGIALLYISI